VLVPKRYSFIMAGSVSACHTLLTGALILMPVLTDSLFAMVITFYKVIILELNQISCKEKRIFKVEAGIIENAKTNVSLIMLMLKRLLR
jgi:hypothetical protein